MTNAASNTGEELESLNKSFKKLGWKRFIFFLAILFSPLVLSVAYTNRKVAGEIKNVSSQIQDIQIVLNNEGILNPSGTGEVEAGKNVSQENPLGAAAYEGSFDREMWTVNNFFTQNERGYYCPSRRGFPHWSMWTKNSLPFNFQSFSLRFQLDGRGNEIPRAFLVSTGEYLEMEQPERASPNMFYRLSLFDGDPKAVRLYDSRGEKVAEDWLDEVPNFESEMYLKIEQRIPSPNRNSVFVTPELTYDTETGQKVFNPLPEKEREFSVNIPKVNLEDVGANLQIGLGAYEGDCFKPTYTTF